MTSKRFLAYISIIFLVPLCAVPVFVSQNNPSFLFAQNENSGGEYSLTISDYDGGSSQTYYTKNGNPLVFEYRYCSPSEEGLAFVTEESYIKCTTPIHGITSLLVTTDQTTFDTYVRFTILKETGSSSFLTTPNTVKLIDIPSTGFAVYFEGSDFLATGITFTYTCM